MVDNLKYHSGFGNYFESEALANALIKGCNSPQHVPFGLYAEQLSGSAFTVPRHHNIHSWLYRIRPSVKHGEFSQLHCPTLQSGPIPATYTPPTQMRWDPLPLPTKPCNFIQSLFTIAANGSPESQQGGAIHLYAATESMENIYFYNADGEFLFVPQEEGLRLKTEFGELVIYPGEIAVIQRGIKFQVELLAATAKGYVCENYGIPFKLPELGIIGANGLANPRDFLIPTAAFEEKTGSFNLWAKFQGQVWTATLSHSPLDVVAWHGSYAPYKYNLSLFNVINSVSFDHPDPSIFTVLTSASPIPHVANIDFVIFPPRWMVAEKTFRPPYYHRNIMSEYMGLITGQYDAKETGFLPGGGSLHNSMSAHGPDKNAFDKATQNQLQPEYYANTLAFMFESQHVWKVTKNAYEATFRQHNYLECWRELDSNFSEKY